MSGARGQNIEKIQERDLYGRNARTVCFNNPDHHNFLMGLMEDFTRSYDLDGIMWGSERYGAFGNAVESVHNRNGNDPSRVTCFCTFCQQKAKARGIDVQRAFEGFKPLETWVTGMPRGQRAAGWLLCDALAVAFPLSGTSCVGDDVERQRSRNLRGHLQACQMHQTGNAGGLARLACS